MCSFSSSTDDKHRRTSGYEQGYSRPEWSLAVDSVVLEGFLATFSVMPSGAISSEGRTGILSVALFGLLWRIE